MINDKDINEIYTAVGREVIRIKDDANIKGVGDVARRVGEITIAAEKKIIETCSPFKEDEIVWALEDAPLKRGGLSIKRYRISSINLVGSAFYYSLKPEGEGIDQMATEFTLFRSREDLVTFYEHFFQNNHTY